MTGRESAKRRWTMTDGVLGAVALMVIFVLLVAPPHGFLDKADRAAYAVCHRIPERAFAIAGRQLPLCARCSGTYLGTFAGVLVLSLRGRGRAGQFPARHFIAVFVAFLAIWAVDGLNSYLTFFPMIPHLYQPYNLLRLVTGSLEGLAIAALALPAMNLSLQWEIEPIPSVATWGDLSWLLVAGAVVVGLVSSGWEPLLFPLALLSGILVVAAVSLLNYALVASLLMRETSSPASVEKDRRLPRHATQEHLLRPSLDLEDSLGSRKRTAAPSRTALWAASIALALGELAVIGLLRSFLEAIVGLPF